MTPLQQLIQLYTEPMPVPQSMIDRIADQAFKAARMAVRAGLYSLERCTRVYPVSSQGRGDIAAACAVWAAEAQASGVDTLSGCIKPCN
jgi:hypothetical protein